MHFVDVKGILSQNNGMNLYRGCTHGCIYCDSRSTCYGFDHPFEDIEVKRNAPQLLEKALSSKRRPCMIGTGSMCDPYMQVEENLGLTRKCLQTIYDHGCGVSLLTKSARVLRDMDLITKINGRAKAVVQMTLTTYDEDLCRIVEPNVSTTRERFEALMSFREAGVPTIVWMCPILPFINDTEENIRGILDYCVRAGVKGIMCFGMGMTLREGDREYFYAALDRHFPGLKERYINTYGTSYNLPSPNEKYLMRIFRDTCAKNGIMGRVEDCFRFLEEFPEDRQQPSLFDM